MDKQNDKKNVKSRQKRGTATASTSSSAPNATPSAPKGSAWRWVQTHSAALLEELKKELAMLKGDADKLFNNSDLGPELREAGASPIGSGPTNGTSKNESLSAFVDNIREVFKGVPIIGKKGSANQIFGVELEKWLPKEDIWIGLVLSSFLINILALVFPLVLLQVYDRVIPNHAINSLIFLSTGVLIAVTFETILRLARAYVGAWADARLGYLSSYNAFKHLLYADLEEFEKDGAGAHLERLNALDTLKGFFGGQAIITILDIPFLILFLAIIAYIHWTMVLIPVIMSAFLMWSAFNSGQTMLGVLNKKTKSGERKFNFVVDVLNGIHTVKALGMEEQLLRRFERLQHGSIKDDYDLTQKTSSTSRNVNFISQINLILVVAYGASLVVDGQMSVGGLSACTLLAGRALQPVNTMIALWGRIQAVRLARNSNAEIMNMSLEESKDAPLISEIKGDIELRNLSLTYPGREEAVLTNINLTVKAGDTIGITGAGLSGKSTLVETMAGLKKPTSGKVLIDGLDIYEHNLYDYRRKIGYLPQHGNLFEGTIMENLTLFKPEMAEKAIQIAKDLGFHDIIDEMPLGYESKVGHGSVDFISRGLKQRIIIGRAFVNDPKIVLFDEANSALDINADKQLKAFFDANKGKFTLILISHRPSMLKGASCVYSLKEGVLVMVQGN